MATITTIADSDNIGDSRADINTNFSNLNTDKLEAGDALGTPASGTATNLTGLPLSTGVTGTLPIANGGTAATTASAARTALGVDAAGTDNSTDVTLSGSGTYISIAGQVITVDPITESDISDLGSYITGITGENLSDLSDVTITSIASGEVIKWNGSAWINQTLSEAGIAAESHTHEGSAILSTGETGGTKFLREDGDGTSSWQAIAGGGDALVANPLSQFAATTSLQFKGVISDETGSGSVVFATSPTLVTPALGTPASGTLTNATGLPIVGGTTGTLSVARGGTGATTAAAAATALGVGTGNSPQFTGVNVGHATDTTITRVSAGVIAVEGVTVPTLSSTSTLTNKTLTSPTLTTPALGTPASGTLTNCTGLPVAGGGTGATTASGAATAIGVGTGDSPQFTGIELGHATDTTITRSAAGQLAVEGSSVIQANTLTYEEVYIDAAAMATRTTNGALAATEEYATNDVISDHYLFDSVTEEGVQFRIVMPDSWNRSTIKAKFFWDAATGASASDGVTWGIAAQSLSNDDAIDAAFSASVDTDDTVIAVGDLHVTAASSAVTVSGTPALGDAVLFEITRVVGDANDDMAEDAKLLGVQIQYGKISGNSTAW